MLKIPLDTEKKKFIDEYIPYKISRLISIHIWEKSEPICHISQGYKNLLSRVCLEDGFTTGRMLLQFLGINMNKKGNLEPSKSREDDVMVNDLGGILFTESEISNISTFDKEILKIFLKRANKGAAHLTKERKNEIDGHEKLKEGISLILKFLQTRFYKPIGIPFNIDFEGLSIDLSKMM